MTPSPDPPPLRQLPERLRYLRRLAGLSARQLDRLAGNRSETHSSLIESGLRPRIRLATAVRLARVFGVPVDWLATGAGELPEVDRILAAVAAARLALESCEAREAGEARETRGADHPHEEAAPAEAQDGGDAHPRGRPR